MSTVTLFTERLPFEVATVAVFAQLPDAAERALVCVHILKIH